MGYLSGAFAPEADGRNVEGEFLAPHARPGPGSFFPKDGQYRCLRGADPLKQVVVEKFGGADPEEVGASEFQKKPARL